jgi:hypothetical protein
MKKTKAALNDIGLFAPLVIAQRMSRIMLPAALRTAADEAEDTRMVAEKSKAASDGIIAMQTEMVSQIMSAWMGMAFGKIPQPLKSIDAIAAAGLKPARAKVKANAKRLSKPLISK